jgi:hypothetical protein
MRVVELPERSQPKPTILDLTTPHECLVRYGGAANPIIAVTVDPARISPSRTYVSFGAGPWYAVADIELVEVLRPAPRPTPAWKRFLQRIQPWTSTR